ncbi:hypothetical protein [Roseospira visakhapatnamensis]|uniref:ABC-type branched-subunit amino acid transport system substrate-binding protein n=1 Tax=Roseospira visakhapatnamensis TaxID=390880 RepID=A0A7W6REN4_9PROT|nr:hypothetical protein [Roseospira visakhapatnamensis]MBB4267145.1 ABC-type branched-subunit amino acid transport system substrate-binding protein [Roseospira visakhapatnamensis]
MITLEDCCGLSGARPDEVIVVAYHERMAPILAAGKVHGLLAEPRGGDTLRRMILDEQARADGRGDGARVEALAILYREACHLYPQETACPESP